MEKTLADKFTDWLYENKSPIWDDRLVDLMDDGDIQLQFLDDMDLPLDTEIE